MNKKSIVVILLITFVTFSYSTIFAVMPHYDELVVSYGISIILKALEILQFVLPSFLYVLLLLYSILKKKINVAKVEIYFIICILLCVFVYISGQIILKNTSSPVSSTGYSSGRLDMITYNGYVLYVHK